MKAKQNLLLLATLCTLGVFAAETPIATDSAEAWRLNNSKKHQQSFKVINYSTEIGDVLEVTMLPTKFSYIELYQKKPIPLAQNAEEFKKITFSLDLFADPADAIQLVAVRLQDATGEIFQYRSAVELRPGTWSRVTISLEKPISVWGGNKDRKIDYPISFAAITVDASKTVTSDVKILIDNLKWNRGVSTQTGDTK